jgi:sortase A
VPLLLAAGLLLIIWKILRGKRDIILAFLGIVLVLSSFALTAYNYKESDEAGKKSKKIVQELEKKIPATETKSETKGSSKKINPDMEMPVIYLNGHNYIGKIEIPSLRLALPVLSEWSYPNLRISPCRYSGSAYTSDLVLAAHNYSTHFGRLKELAVGDEVRFTDMDGNVFEYQVEELEELQPTDVAEMTEGTWALTMFTCTIGGRTRIAVRCSEET